MSATVTGTWPRITEDELDLLPGFFNDCNAWANYLAKAHESADVVKLHTTLGVDALLSHTTDGMKESEVRWVKPSELQGAAERLRAMVAAQEPRCRALLDAYAQGANNVDPVEKELMQDLSDVAAIAAHAGKCGARKMTLEVNW